MTILSFTAVQALAEAQRLELPPTYIHWLSKNWGIWHEFCDLARQVRERGRTRWSARAIIHVLRWNRVIRDATDTTYKVNNNWTPNMARLYNSLHGFAFFEQRDGDMSP